MPYLRFLIAAAALFTLSRVIGADSVDSLQGTWSAPSFSQPSTPIFISLLPDGKATELVGTYRGAGTWSLEQGAARITWESGWTNLLRPSSDGGFELVTWKAGSSPSAPPDAIQPAQRVDSPAR